MNPLSWYKARILDCWQKYSSVLNLMARTDDALYDAIRCVYELYLKMHAHSRLRDAFYHELRSNNMRRGGNEALTLVERAFFPHVLLQRKKRDHPSHKADIDKASNYAKTITYAQANKVKPEGFIKFLRENGGIQATAKAETERLAERTERTEVRLGKPQSPGATGATAARGRPPRPGDRPFPLALWCSSGTAAEIIEVTDSVYYEVAPNHFIIHGKWHDTYTMIVTDFAIASKPSPQPNPPIRPMPQPNSKRGPASSQASNPAKAMRPPTPKQMPSQPLGKRPTPFRQAPLGKTPPGKTSWQQ